MSRTTTAAQANALAAPRRLEFARVFVENADGIFVDYTALAGHNWFRGASIDVNLDQPISQATIKLNRSHGVLSLSPLRSDSTLNRDAGGNFVPALDVGRGVYVEVAILDPAVAGAPIGSDWIRLWEGTTDTVDVADQEIVMTGRDAGGRLADVWLPRDTALIVEGSPTMSLEAAIQALIDTAIPTFGPGSSPVTLYTPVPTEVAVTRFGYHREPLMDAIQRLVDTFGWSCRYLYDATSGTFRLTLFKVDRAKVVPDLVLGPNRYTTISKLNLTRVPVRNRVLLSFTDSFAAGGPVRSSVLVEDVASQFKYGGVRPIVIEEASDSAINTPVEATAMASALIADLKDPKAELETTLPLLWPVELADLIRFSANEVHQDGDQDLAVSGIRHTIEPNKLSTTTLSLRGTPAGSYKSWFYRARRISSPPPSPVPAIVDVRWTIAGATATVTFRRTDAACEIWMGYGVVSGLSSPDWDPVASAVSPLAGDAVSFAVPAPVDGQVTLVQIEARGADLAATMIKRLVITAAPQLPSVELDDLETATTGTQWVRFTERGIAIVSVDVQVQVGTNPISAVGAVLRGPGAASTVKGGVLGSGEYEHDVPLDPTRQSWIVIGYTLANGTRIVLPPFGFDRDRLPNLISVVPDAVTPTRLRITADSDTKSIGIYSTTRSYGYEVDGAFLDVDVAGAGNLPGATNVGLAAGSTDTFLVRAFSEPIAALSAGHLNTPTADLHDDKLVPVFNGAPGDPGAPAASWLTVQAYAPAEDDSAVATIDLRASAAPAGWTVALLISEEGEVPSVDFADSVTPPLAAPPTVLTTYEWTSSHVRTPRTPTTRLVTMRVRAELRDGSGVVQDSRDTSASWYASDAFF